MCTLKPPFDANSLQQLAKKIAKGIYAPIPSTYSKEMKNLVNTLLITDTKKRPRVHEILAMPVIKNRIKEFLTTTIANIEFNHTVIHKKDL
jgi:NIMA (never in mitosis gene a)-related kinase